MRSLIMALAVSGCVDAVDVGAVLSLPQALVDCANPPDDLQARVWVSGLDDPCVLDVDGDNASKRCAAPPGTTRRVTLDWFIALDDTDVVLAQARDEAALAGATDDVTISFDDDDYRIDDCQDMRRDSFNGADTVDIDGVARPVCDLDDDDVPNVTEVCAGDSPLGGP